MTLCRAIHDKDHPYTLINHSITKDQRLSWKAKGIWLYAFSRPDDWQFYEKDLINQSTDSRDSVRSGLKELESCGYLHKEQPKDSKTNRYEKSNWYFFETPKSVDEIQKIFPMTDFPSPDLASPENHPLLITDLPITEQTLFVADDPVGSPRDDKIQIKVKGGETEEVCISDIFRVAIIKKVNWTAEEINYAWEALASYGNIVYDWVRFIEGTIEKHRNILKSKHASKGKVCKKKNTQESFKEGSTEKDTSEHRSQEWKDSVRRQWKEYCGGISPQTAS